MVWVIEYDLVLLGCVNTTVPVAPEGVPLVEKPLGKVLVGERQTSFFIVVFTRIPALFVNV